LTGVVQIRHATMGGGAIPGDAKLQVWIFDMVLIIWVPERLNLT
jgi:hypothetical protein